MDVAEDLGDTMKVVDKIDDVADTVDGIGRIDAKADIKLPQGISADAFSDASKLIRENVGNIKIGRAHV